MNIYQPTHSWQMLKQQYWVYNNLKPSRAVKLGNYKEKKMTNQEMIAAIAEKTKTEIRNADLNPAGYNTELYETAYSEVFGCDVISDESEEKFRAVITDIWQSRA